MSPPNALCNSSPNSSPLYGSLISTIERQQVNSAPLSGDFSGASSELDATEDE